MNREAVLCSFLDTRQWQPEQAGNSGDGQNCLGWDAFGAELSAFMGGWGEEQGLTKKACQGLLREPRVVWEVVMGFIMIPPSCHPHGVEAAGGALAPKMFCSQQTPLVPVPH